MRVPFNWKCYSTYFSFTFYFFHLFSDYYDQWKILQYYVPKFFASHIFTGQINNNSGKKSLQLFLVADITGLNNVTAKIKTARWDSLGTNSENSFKVSVVCNAFVKSQNFGT